MTFDEAFERLMVSEGGTVSNPHDPGGLTRYGVSQRAYPHTDIASLTESDAKAIYLKDYWYPAGCDAVPEGIRFDLFDAAVNSGIRSAVRMLQRACGETDDGILGPRTLQALQTIPVDRLHALFNAERIEHLASLDTWATFSRGWALRIARNLRAAG
jgi:lysozyme family protein